MAMPLWLTRPREFERLDRAINDECATGSNVVLDGWVAALDALVTNPTNATAVGIGGAAQVFGPASQVHFKKDWVGDYVTGTAPLYWPYAWGSPPHPASERVLIDRLLSFGLMASIKKVSDPNHPAGSPRPTHITIWVCTNSLSDGQEARAYVDKAFRRRLFRVGVVESRDVVALVISTPHPESTMSGPSEPSNLPGEEPVYREPVSVTSGFTVDDTPTWTEPPDHGGH